MKQVNEGFFKDAYQKYRAKVLGILQKHMGIVVPTEIIHSVEDWIRDYFVDKFDELDCARAIRDNFRRQFALGESMELDEALDTLNKAGLIAEGAYKDILHQKFAEKRAKREQDQKDYDSRQKQMAKISKKLNKEIEEFVSDLADEMVSDQVTCKYNSTDWVTTIQIENKQFKVDTYGFGVVEFAKYEYGRWNNIFNTRNLDNLDEFLEKVFEYLTDVAA